MTERYEKSPAKRLGILNGTQSISTWSEWNYRVSRNYEQQKWYSGSRQSVFLSEISYYAKRNSSLSKLGISFLFDKLNSATAAFKAFPKGWLAVAILLF